MKTRSLVVAALLAVVMVVGSGVASAAPIVISFSKIEGADPDLGASGQLYVEVSDGVTQADFKFINANPPGVASVITSIYFAYAKAGTNPLLTGTIGAKSPGVNFIPGQIGAFVFPPTHTQFENFRADEPPPFNGVGVPPVNCTSYNESFQTAR